MKIQIVAALTVAASLFVAASSVPAADYRTPPKDSFLLEVSGVKALNRAVDERAVVVMEVAAKMGIGNQPMTPEELGFLLEVSGIRVNTAKVGEELGFLLEVSGLRSRPLNINDARGLVIGSGLGLKMSEPDLEFNCTDDLASILMLTGGVDRPIASSEWILMISERTGFLMD
ncbi:hypothetical protein [Neorhodopirellula pilleata]|uniref:Uncharacterized protein n=1 Tax=Neorhodopirellula pilleata TaxID=2714738 RepID=A0A5C6AU71_9BACT|nr:hypothetical protein [Neorhodopirellula pilleata]TWU03138.1 hypothetical protein Pla100_00560 [Neorhodopirellula pilleata]